MWTTQTWGKVGYLYMRGFGGSHGTGLSEVFLPPLHSGAAPQPASSVFSLKVSKVGAITEPTPFTHQGPEGKCRPGSRAQMGAACWASICFENHSEAPEDAFKVVTVPLCWLVIVLSFGSHLPHFFKQMCIFPHQILSAD